MKYCVSATNSDGDYYVKWDIDYDGITGRIALHNNRTVYGTIAPDDHDSLFTII